MSMGWMEAGFLGLLQGLTEFLPISSSAHLRIAGEFLPSGADPGAAFTAITQIGTEMAVLVYFWSDIMRIAAAWLRQNLRLGPYDKADARLGWLIIVGSVPIVFLGLFFKDAIEHSLRNLYITAVMLIVFGIVLGVADKIGEKRYKLNQLIWRDGILFGFAQAMALIPGVSRSGGTISAGLLLGYTREAAARYSFLLAVPAVFGSGFYQLFKSIGEDNPVGWGQTGLATLIAFIVGYAVIVVFLKLVSTKSYMPFVWYRVVIGVILLGLLGTGVISAGG
ncbi:undecaprenyl-diphosphate phosphatase [Agrobacterium sp. NPDC089420]|uniref:undecaprenyl-diphosphate phosphatase n=1 Tax=Agrobacterium sp. NPDC089420 TaxID=3363918 RepID=UPI00384E6E66